MGMRGLHGMIGRRLGGVPEFQRAQLPIRAVLHREYTTLSNKSISRDEERLLSIQYKEKKIQ
jgi:hypothetical protein